MSTHSPTRCLTSSPTAHEPDTVNATRPRTVVFVAGTATDVGKTWWAAALARELRSAGVRVSARKPVQSSEPGAATDADVLAAATGEESEAVCPPSRTLLIPWAPPMAARELGAPPFTIADLAGGIDWPSSADVGLVEGVGGPRSPISDDGDNVDLAHLVAPDLVLLVADAGLGTINAVRLSADAFGNFPVVVALNRYRDEPLHERNLEHLTTVDGFDVVTMPRALADRLRIPS
jgi:dethiobiotin synthetase